MKRWLDLPEINVAIFAFLLNLAWEFAQVPLFAGMAQEGRTGEPSRCVRGPRRVTS
jgi:hypothetical protein